MLPKRLQRSESPAEALPNQHARSLRRLRPRNGFFLIRDPPSQPPNGDSQVGILGDRVRGNPSYCIDGFLSPRAQSSWHHRYAIQQIEGALLHVLAGDIFERLPAREPTRAVAHFYVPRDRPSLGVGEMA